MCIQFVLTNRIFHLYCLISEINYVEKMNICELCGSTIYTDHEICSSCMTNINKQQLIKKHNKRVERTKEERKVSKFIGLKALKGTEKQKSWGESIRKQFIEIIGESSENSDDITDIYHVLTSQTFEKADFWIDRRDDLQKFKKSLVKAVQLRRKANSMDQGTEEYKLVSNEYHAVISGF